MYNNLIKINNNSLIIDVWKEFRPSIKDYISTVSFSLFLD